MPTPNDLTQLKHAFQLQPIRSSHTFLHVQSFSSHFETKAEVKGYLVSVLNNQSETAYGKCERFYCKRLLE